MKSALFVDFDNVYSGLRKLDPAIADRFARQPMAWMDWVVNTLAVPDHMPAGARRRVLVRRCYLNPQAYQRFRPSFNLAGFEIIDCPALTGEGKTSTDIHMVLDIIDLLQHEAHYDEFIVFSADADFTPVLRKLRRWDRRTTVLAIGFPSAAYRASADLLIDQDAFVREALGASEEDLGLGISMPAEAPAESNGAEILAAATRLIRQTVDESAYPVPAAKLAALVLSRLDGVDAASWGGLGNFRGMVEVMNLAPLKVSWEGSGVIYDPARHEPPAPPRGKVDADPQEMAELIKITVAQSAQPVPCARLASLLTSRYDGLAADWNGKGVFRKFVESLDLSPVTFNWRGSGGYAYDPARHATEGGENRPGTTAWQGEEELFGIARQIHEVTGVPLLHPADYRALFEAIAADLAEESFELNDTGKRVRDRCRDAGHHVSRADVTFVLRGLLFRGHVFGQGEDDVASLSRKLADNVRSLCLREQMMIDWATDGAIRKWIAGQ
ncbi:NYN domain-containing protein [Azoarcus indigens]|uniref:NYN domain-containing protein n=1 Tax=Azoarcus indigens TaxID=29545 RepID=A0A4R6DFR8_9RHOO|nr:NYN domain-containing protein [Azoarcus indigens]NMG67565.1 NYN domain-containing protein [Azoarcus indigens]TDN43516.1 NYN domain-containing protein [Azoarcus indigens]